MDFEIEQKDNKIQFLEDKRGIQDFKIVEEMSRSHLNNISSNKNCDKIMITLTKTPNNHKYIEN